MSVLEWSGALLPWRDDLDDLKERIGRLFRRPEPRRQIGLYLDGLIGEVDKKNGWQLAEYAGDPAPWRMQALLGRTIWDQERARDICREYVIERLGDASGVLVVDETGFLKKGTHSVGVARQYSGTAGRIENCQVGVFLGYASAKGHALIDRRLYLPKEWATDVERREAACIPDEGRVHHQAEDRHRNGGGGAGRGRSLCVGSRRCGLRQRQDATCQFGRTRQALCSSRPWKRKADDGRFSHIYSRTAGRRSRAT